MAGSMSPLRGGILPQRQNQDVAMPAYPQPFGLCPGYSDPAYLPLHYAFVPQAQQQSLPHGQPAHHLHAQHPYLYPADPVPPTPYVGNPSFTYQYSPTTPRMWQALPQHYQHHPELHTYARTNQGAHEDDMSSAQSIGGDSYSGFSLPSYSSLAGRPSLQWPQPSPRSFGRRPHRPVPPNNSLFSDMTEPDVAIEDELRNYPHIRMNGIPNPNPTGRRTLPHQRHHRQGSSESIQASRTADSHVPLADLDLSSRNPNRRSFDRYMNDISSDAFQFNGATRSPTSRTSDRMARRQRTVGNLSFRRISSITDHPNVPSTEQLRQLKESLQHLLPGELPEGIDAACDICQKDYSIEHVQPSEANEVAIQLPCRHVFGQHCINTWFDTCKKHKNKITCPMCRKVLIEPFSRENAQSRGQLMERLDRLRRQGDGRRFYEGIPRAILETGTTGQL